MVAAESDHIGVVMCLAEAGAKVHLSAHLLAKVKNPLVAGYLMQKQIGNAEVDVIHDNEALMRSYYQPPSIMPDNNVSEIVKPVFKQVIEDADNVGALLPINGVNLGLDIRQYIKKKSNPDGQVQEIENRIAILDLQIEDAAHIDKHALEKEKVRLRQELKHFKELRGHENQEAKLRITDKVINLHQKGYFAASVFQKGSNALLGLKGIAAITGAVSSTLATLECWSILDRLKIRQSHLTEVRTSLEKAKDQLNSILTLGHPSPMQSRLIRMKLCGIETRIKEIQTKRFELDVRKLTTRATLAGTSLACTLMAYSAVAYYAKTSKGPDVIDLDEALEFTGNLNLFSEMLPLIGPPIVKGTCWMWQKGIETIRGRKETPRETQMRQESERVDYLTKMQKRLANEHQTILEELQSGIEISLGVLSIPEVGSARYNELQHRIDEINTSRGEMAFELEKLIIAGRLKMTSNEVSQALQSFKNDLDDADNKREMLRILKAAKIDVSLFDSDPISCILSYLLK